jgi:hypothetical protein
VFDQVEHRLIHPQSAAEPDPISRPIVVSYRVAEWPASPRATARTATAEIQARGQNWLPRSQSLPTRCRQDSATAQPPGG